MIFTSKTSLWNMETRLEKGWDERRNSRFDAHIEQYGECDVWTGVKSDQGYGAFYIGGSRHAAHRLAWLRTGRTIPLGIEVDHRCLNKSCVRIEHLRLATGKQNQENQAGAYRNSKSGIRGVHWVPKLRKYRVEAQHNGRQHIGGYFASIDEAEQAAIELRNSLFTFNEMDRREAA